MPLLGIAVITVLYKRFTRSPQLLSVYRTHLTRIHTEYRTRSRITLYGVHDTTEHGRGTDSCVLGAQAGSQNAVALYQEVV